MKSAILTVELAQEAMRVATPAIERIIAREKGRNVIYVVILDPVAAAYGERKILWEGAIGEQDSKTWKRDYAAFANQKACVSFDTKMPSHMAQRDAPYMYQRGHFKYGGGEYRNGIIVAASGLAWHNDYAVSAMVAGILHAFCIGSFETELAGPALYVKEGPPAPFVA